MNIILLAAGIGSRLRPITDVIPKCLVPINGKPLLNYWLNYSHSIGVTPIVNTHYMASMVEAHLESLSATCPANVVHEPVLLNTGGTIKKNYEKIKGEKLMLVHADNLSSFDMRDFIEAHNNRPNSALMTMMTFQTDHPESCGIVELDDDGLVAAFHEKVKNPPGNLANAAVYIMEPEVVEQIKNMPGEEIDFSLQILPSLMGKIFTWENTCYHRDIGNIRSLLKAQEEFLCNNDNSTFPASTYEDSTIELLAQAVQKAIFNEKISSEVEILDNINNGSFLKPESIYLVKKAPVGFCSSEIKKNTGVGVYALSN